jgi:hypothetical protein
MGEPCVFIRVFSEQIVGYRLNFVDHWYCTREVVGRIDLGSCRNRHVEKSEFRDLLKNAVLLDDATCGSC